MSRRTLRHLYAEHTGKVSDKWSSYLTEYDRLFAEYRDKPVRLLEIGVQNGGSLEIWSKYFPNALALIGCDINPECARLAYADPRIQVIVGNVTDRETRAQLLQRSPQFDIVIDDGSHLSSDIIKSFSLYFPCVVDGGIFVAEDLHCGYWDQFEGGLFDPYSSISFFKRLADIINHEHWAIPRARADILRGIFSKYGCEVDGETLSGVHSVEFVNSMCVVRKAPAAENRVGRRVIAGSLELVAPSHLELRDQPYQLDPLRDQSHNPWAARTIPPDEALPPTEQALATEQQQAAALEQQSADLMRRLSEVEQALSVAQHQAVTFERQSVDLTQRLSESEQTLGDARRQTAEWKDKLYVQAARADLSAAEAITLKLQLTAVYSSTSWRITKPIRAVASLVRGLPRKLRTRALTTYHGLPLSTAQRIAVKNLLFTCFPIVFRKYALYKAWALSKENRLQSSLRLHPALDVHGGAPQALTELSPRQFSLTRPIAARLLAIYRRVPFPRTLRIGLKDFIFGHFPLLFRRHSLYRAWASSRQLRALPVGTGSPHSLQTPTAVQPPSSVAKLSITARSTERLARLKKILWIVNHWDLQTQKYRVHAYADALKGKHIDSTVVHDTDLAEVDPTPFDIVIFNRIAASPQTLALRARCKELGIPTAYDIDDLVFCPERCHLLRFTASLAASQAKEFRDGMAQCRELLLQCDAVTTSTHALAREIRRLGQLAFVLPNAITRSDQELFVALSREAPRTRTYPIRIGYFAGTKTHEYDFAQCVDALAGVMAMRQEVELMLVGHIDAPERLASFGNRVLTRPLMPHTEMLRELATIDINLSPLELNNAFTECKSELKIFEAAALSIPTIASPTSTFSSVIQDGRNGMLAATTEQWYRTLIRLIDDHIFRTKLGERARDELARRYLATTTVDEATAIYTALVSRRIPPKPGVFDVSRLGDEARPLISIVAVLYRKSSEVRYFLEALRRQDFAGRFEVILVDDRSPDDTADVVRDFLAKMQYAAPFSSRMDIKLLQNQQNVGNCTSRNRAISQASGDIVVVIDADCMLNQTYLSEHYWAFRNGDCDVAIGPMNIETNGDNPYSVLGRHEADTALRLSNAQLQDDVNLDSFVNCITRNFSIRREFLSTVLRVPLFDERFSYSSDPNSGFGWEDVEMGCRLFKAGARIRFLPRTFSIHVSHPSTTDEQTKPLRSLKNFRRLHELHPELNMLARQWSIRTYQAILDWVASNGLSLEGNPDYVFLESVFSRYRRSPITIARQRPLRVLTYRWHCPHQYELYRGPHQFTLATGAGTALCDGWEWDKRPLPGNARFVHVDQVNPRDYDLAILHFDENVLHPEKCHGKVPLDWGSTLRWFLSNVPVPKVAICHGTPQFAGQYDPAYDRPDLGQVDEASRTELVRLFQDVLVVCNSHQAQAEWGFNRSTVIWHGFAPTDYPTVPSDRATLTMLYPALKNRPHYNGLFIYEKVRELVNGMLDISTLQVPDPSPRYPRNTREWAEAKFRNYAREIARYSIYLNPTLRSPMPRSRGEAMMAGLVTVSMRNHDVDSFIRNGVNGFFADTPDEMAEQLRFLARHPSAREAMAAASRRTAMDLFNQDRYLAKWSNVFGQLTT